MVVISPRLGQEPSDLAQVIAVTGYLRNLGQVVGFQ